MSKKGASNNMWVFIAIIVVVVAVWQKDAISAFFAAKPAEPTPTPVPQPAPGCNVDTTTVSLSPRNVDDVGTVTYVNARKWINGNPLGVANTSATTTASPSDKLEVWFAASDATFYGSHSVDVIVPCKGTFEIAGNLYTKDNSVTMTIFDENDNAQPGDGSSYNQTLGVGEEKTLKLRVKGNYQKYYGNPEVAMNNVLLAEYSRTQFKEVALLNAGVKAASQAVPIVETVSSTSNVEVGYLMPKIAGSANVDYQLLVRADSILNPSSNIVLKIYDSDFFYNSKTGKIAEGYEDENNADIGATSEPTVTVYIA